MKSLANEAPPDLTSALDGGDCQIDITAALPLRERITVSVGYEAGQVPQPVWTLWSREKSLGSAKNRTPAVQLLARRYND
jgi:hypothetical protein